MKRIAIHPKSFLFILLVSLSLVASNAYAQKAISFLANVHPDTDQTFFNIKVNDQAIPSNTLHNMLRPGGGSVLRVTSIHGTLFGRISAPAPTDYALIFLGAINPRFSVSGFGAGTLSVSGATTTQINFDPGLYVHLNSDQTLTLRSLIQSNQLAHIEVHGFLEDA